MPACFLALAKLLICKKKLIVRYARDDAGCDPKREMTLERRHRSARLAACARQAADLFHPRGEARDVELVERQACEGADAVAQILERLFKRRFLQQV